MYLVTVIDREGRLSVHEAIAADAFEAVSLIQAKTGLRAVRAAEELGK